MTYGLRCIVVTQMGPPLTHRSRSQLASEPFALTFVVSESLPATCSAQMTQPYPAAFSHLCLKWAVWHPEATIWTCVLPQLPGPLARTCVRWGLDCHLFVDVFGIGGVTLVSRSLSVDLWLTAGEATGGAAWRLRAEVKDLALVLSLQLRATASS